MATAFSAEGGRLILWDINEAGVEALRAELGNAVAYVCDLSNRDEVYTVAQRVLREEGPIDLLINNAGIVSGRPLLEISDEAIERTFAVNTLALFWTARAFLPAMIQQGHGHIVTIASAGGLVGTPRLTDYCASKSAAIAFDESLRLEMKRLGYPIDTTVVCPFYIGTEMFNGVQTRFSWLLPILKPAYVVRRILSAIRKKRRRLIMPRFVYVVYPTRLLPASAFDALIGFFGINRSMDAFEGSPGKSEHPNDVVVSRP